jgi:hypothetical protein
MFIAHSAIEGILYPKIHPNYPVEIQCGCILLFKGVGNINEPPVSLVATDL